MIVLGVTSDDKGTQLETLVKSVLVTQGYARVRTNLVVAGGNELDLVAERESDLVTDLHVTPIMGEAKAYGTPLSMPKWHAFLGKLFIERARRHTVGVLIALNGVNGNVAGSYAALREQDRHISIIDGSDLVALAQRSGEVAQEPAVREQVFAQYQREILALEVVYYGATYRWIVRWRGDEYSVVDGQGTMLSAEQLEELRPALEATISGTLLATAEEQARAEARHNARVETVNRLFSAPVPVSDPPDDIQASLADEPFCRIESGYLTLIPADEIGAAAVTRLFRSLFENTVDIRHLEFMAYRLHDAYVMRLLDAVPRNQSGFVLDEDSRRELAALAPLFPSLWLALGSQVGLIGGEASDDPGVIETWRTALWESVFAAVRSDFANPYLRGFLYDRMRVAEIEEATKVTVKTKDAPLGGAHIVTRHAIGQAAEDLVSEAGTRHVYIRLLPNIPEPWERGHPEPTDQGAAGRSDAHRAPEQNGAES